MAKRSKSPGSAKKSYQNGNDWEEDFDWGVTTWEGSRREQIRRWSELTMDEILAAQEEMADLAQSTGELSREQDLPRNDPFTSG